MAASRLLSTAGFGAAPRARARVRPKVFSRFGFARSASAFRGRRAAETGPRLPGLRAGAESPRRPVRIGYRLLKNVVSTGKTGQSPMKKRNVCRIVEPYEKDCNAVFPSAIVFRQPLVAADPQESGGKARRRPMGKAQQPPWVVSISPRPATRRHSSDDGKSSGSWATQQLGLRRS